MSTKLASSRGRRHLVLNVVVGACIGLALGAVGSLGTFEKFGFAPYWAGVSTGVLCTFGTFIGGGLGYMKN